MAGREEGGFVLEDVADDNAFIMFFLFLGEVEDLPGFKGIVPLKWEDNEKTRFKHCNFTGEETMQVQQQRSESDEYEPAIAVNNSDYSCNFCLFITTLSPTYKLS